MPEPTGYESALRQARYWWDRQRRSLEGRPKQRIVLLHVPRCAGTSITDALSAHFPPHRMSRIQTSATARVASASGRQLESFRQELLWYLARSGDAEFISGHVSFSPQMMTELSPRWAFITVLRDPVERFLSSYLYRRHNPSSHAALDQPLARYVQTRRARHSGAIYVRYFAGDGEREPTPERIQRAIQNLHHLHLVGFTEQLEQFSWDIHQRFGLNLRIPWRNRAPRYLPEDHGRVSPELHQRIKRLCAPDQQVYTQLWRTRAGRSHT